MVPADETRALIASEIDAARQWASRHGVALDWIVDRLELRASMTQPTTGESFFYVGQFLEYRELPPIWLCTNDQWQIVGKVAYPKPDGPSPLAGSLYHTNGLICAPFSRYAYAEHQGPHGDWGGPARWQTAGAQYVQAGSVGDMLGALHAHLQYTNGRLSA